MSDKRHNYEYDVDSSSETAPANVIRLVGNNKRVLEIGCGPGSITKLLHQENNCQVTGLELDTEAIKIVAPFCAKIFQADLNSVEWPRLLDGLEAFDVVVAADVLEHLYDPWTTLRRMVPFIRSDGYMVISLPHVGHAAIVACLINGDFDYRDWGLLDRTHIRFFGLKNIEDMFTQAGLKIIEAKYVITPPEETEFAGSWAKLPVAVKEVIGSCVHAHVYQVVVKAVPSGYPGKAISLIPPLRLHAKASRVTTLKTYIKNALSNHTKKRIRQGLNLLRLE